MAIPTKRAKVIECSTSKNFWLILFQEKTSHGEELTKAELHELYLDLRDMFNEEDAS